MVHLTPVPAGDDLDEDLFLDVCAALGYDPEKVANADEDPGGKCPCCAIDDVMDLLKAQAEAAYRKGWHRVIDGSTPHCPDLLISPEVTAQDIDAALKDSRFVDENGKSIDTISPPQP